MTLTLFSKQAWEVGLLLFYFHLCVYVSFFFLILGSFHLQKLNSMSHYSCIFEEYSKYSLCELRRPKILNLFDCQTIILPLLDQAILHPNLCVFC